MTDRSRGFTLIELLVVVLIIGLIISITVINPSSNNPYSQLKKEASRLVFMFDSASDRALLGGRETGFSIQNNNNYVWWEWNRADEKWQRLQQQSWQAYTLPEGMELSIDGSASATDKQDAGVNVVFYSDGTLVPVRLLLYFKNNQSNKLILETDGISSLTENKTLSSN